MNCLKCNTQLNEGAVFCGKCGTPVATNTNINPSPVVEGKGKATAALILGILGLLGWVIPIVGLVMGVLAIIFGSITLKTSKKKFALIGIIFGTITVALSLFSWGYNVMEGGVLDDLGMVLIGY